MSKQEGQQAGKQKAGQTWTHTPSPTLSLSIWKPTTRDESDDGVVTVALGLLAARLARRYYYTITHALKAFISS